MTFVFFGYNLRYPVANFREAHYKCIANTVDAREEIGSEGYLFVSFSRCINMMRN